MGRVNKLRMPFPNVADAPFFRWQDSASFNMFNVNNLIMQKRHYKNQHLYGYLKRSRSRQNYIFNKFRNVVHTIVNILRRKLVSCDNVKPNQLPYINSVHVKWFIYNHICCSKIVLEKIRICESLITNSLSVFGRYSHFRDKVKTIK